MLTGREAIVNLKGVSFRYKNGTTFALKNLDLEINRGDTLFLMGPTGAGKSTLCLTLNGLIPHMIKGELKGEINIRGLDTQSHKVKEFAPLLGLVFQDFENQLFSTNVESEIAFGPENMGLSWKDIDDRVKNAMRLTKLEGFEKRDPFSLSGGERQRLAIASVISLRAEILCFDEAFTDLDPLTKGEFLRIFPLLKRERGETLLFVDHDCEKAINSDRVALMKEGRIEKIGSPQELLHDPKLLGPFKIRPHPIAELFHWLDISPISFSVAETATIFHQKGIHLRDKALRDIKERDEDRKRLYGPPQIEIRSLQYSYSDNSKALDDIDLSIREGEFLAIIGENGSGKTTLLRHLNGLLMPARGDIFIEGENTKDTDTYYLSQKIGYVFQNPDHQIFSSTVEEEITFGLRQRSLKEDDIQKRVGMAMEIAGLEEYRSQDPFVLTKGVRQKIALASVLAANQKIIVLDEPTTGLDYDDVRSIMNLLVELNKSGHTIIIVTHQMWVVCEYAHRVLVMNKGRVILDDSPREVFSREEILRESSIVSPALVRLSQRLGVTLLSKEEFLWCLGESSLD